VKIHLHVELEDFSEAPLAIKVAEAIASIAEGNVVTSLTNNASPTPGAGRTRRTQAQIAADKAAADKAEADKAAQASADTKPDAAALYEQLSGQTLADNRGGVKTEQPAADPLAAFMTDAAPAAAAKSRDEMVAAITKLMGEKGVPWTRENIILKYSLSKFSEMSDEIISQIFTEHCK